VNPGLRAEALAGPFEAVIADRYGDVIPLDDLRSADDPDELEVTIRRRSALPFSNGEERRLSGVTAGGDIVAEWSGFEEHDEVEACWIRAEAMAAGLNAAAGT